MRYKLKERKLNLFQGALKVMTNVESV